MTFNWEAEMKAVRSKATAAARHGERTVGGVAETLQILKAREKQLASVEKAINAIEVRLGSLEAILQSLQAFRAANTPRQQRHPLPSTWSAAIGLATGIALSSAFFWN
ncbi:hypothetical protein SAMN05421688_3299 [Poseidonocella pacifica]|uniref:Uncharacterized protein n=1 Tax=Poseidonocella pacifica TaxID=871651 RepID=A0A1I0YRC5_9RHOB|nr:hypothetical protein [Poseidonocella pacifica]SFB15874.1 hypothetical protein SAMN05421688_3299 [Poseidonocella pacifica]